MCIFLSDVLSIKHDTHARETLGQAFYNLLFTGLLASSQYASGSISTQVFLVFLCLQTYAVPKFQVATACFSGSPNFKLIKIIPCCGCHQINCPNYRKCNLKKSKFRSARSHHPNVFTFTLFLSEGRAGISWEPSNKLMLFFPPP
jgi:hypothetical protein